MPLRRVSERNAVRGVRPPARRALGHADARGQASECQQGQRSGYEEVRFVVHDVHPQTSPLFVTLHRTLISASPSHHAALSLLALNGLRVSEAVGTDIQALGTERVRRTLAITRKGGKKAVIPLAPRTARVIDLDVGERCNGLIFVTATGAAA
jgi:integrase